MAFEISRFGSDSSNVKSILGGVNYYRYYNKDNNTLTTPGYFPSNLGLEVGDRIHVVPATKTDPDELYVVNTIVNGVITMKQIDVDGAVDSVNGKTGNVVLGANDVLPTQTGNAGKFLTTDGTDASWSDKPLVNKSTDTTSVSILGESNGFANSVAVGQNAMTRGETVAVGYGSEVESRNIAIGYGASAKTSYGGSVAIGHSANADISSAGWKASVAIGPKAKASASGSIQISATKVNNTTVTPTNTDANTFKVSNDNGNYEMMSADGTIPTARLTKVNSTITLTAAGWSSNTQTVNVTGMNADGVVFPCPIPADQADYTSAGILCTAQAAGTLTFTCDTVPSGDIDVNVVML